MCEKHKNRKPIIWYGPLSGQNSFPVYLGNFVLESAGKFVCMHIGIFVNGIVAVFGQNIGVSPVRFSQICGLRFCFYMVK